MFKDSDKIMKQRENAIPNGTTKNLNGKNPIVDFQYRMFDQRMLDKYFPGRGNAKTLSLAGRGPFC